MPKDPEPRLDTPGLAAGPGPTPPGFDDGTPRGDEPAREPEPGEPGAAEQQRKAGEVSERSAGNRAGATAEDMGEEQPDEG
jgi:hypothetical protein